MSADPSNLTGGVPWPPTANAPLRILLVEDDELDRRAVRRYLRQSGLSLALDEAADPADALERICSASYDCVLLDYYLPGMESPALLKHIRDTSPEVPVIMFTGRGDEEIAVELMKAGAADYLPKAALSPDRLASSLRCTLETARATAARRRAEAQLRAEGERFRTLANTIPQLAWMADTGGTVQWYNQRWYDYTGAPVEEPEGGAWQRQCHPDHSQRVREGFQRAVETGEPWEDTFPLKGKDGVYRWFLTRAVPVSGEGEQITGWLGTSTDITERLDAEQALREREAEFRTLANTIPQLAWISDSELRRSWFNERWYEFSGLTFEESRDFGWQRLHHPEDAERAFASQREAFQCGESWDATIRLRRNDGVYHWFLCRAVPVRDRSGKVLRWFGTNTDVTQRLQAEHALRESEERLRRAFEIETVGIIYFTTEGEITGANDAFLRMAGYTRQDLEAGRLRWDELTPPEWIPPSLRAVEEFKVTGRTTPYEKEYFRKDGGRWWALFAATRLNEREGVEFVVDITEQKRAEALAAEQKQLLEQVVRGRPLEAVLLEFARFIERYSHQALCSILLLDDSGRLRHAAAPSLPASFTAALDGASIGPMAGSCGSAVYRREPVLATDIATDARWTEHRDLALRSALRACWSIPISNAAGDVLGTVAIYHHAPWQPSEQDWELTDIATSIAALVIERTRAEHEREKLLDSEREARVQAERAARLRDEVLGIVAHDLRNPLSTILNTAAILAQPVPPEKRSRYAGIMRRAASESDRLIKDLLDVTSIESGALAIDQRQVELGSLLSESLEQFEEQSRACEIVLGAEIPADLPPVFADRGRVIQVISNLVGNALKFTPPGGRISLRAGSEENCVRVSLSNTGDGIPAEHLPHLFDRFWQAERTSRAGAGLGLAICRGIIEAHGGRIWAESAAGCGATFHFTLPSLNTWRRGDAQRSNGSEPAEEPDEGRGFRERQAPRLR